MDVEKREDRQNMKKIGILTFHRAYNCGAVLQAWALQTLIEQTGGVCCVLP